MLLSRLYIKNYRCFGNSTKIVEFSTSGLTALIGPNNVGKSTVLKALEILLGDKWPTGQFNEDDFHNNNFDNDIILACEFTSLITIKVNENTQLGIKGVVVRAKHLSTGFGESSVDVEYRLIESDDNLEDLDYDNLDFARYMYSSGRSDKIVFVSQIVRNQLPIVITVPLIKLHSEQPSNKWSVLGRMLQKVEAIFKQDQTKEDNFKQKITEAVGILRSPQEFNDIEADIKQFWDKTKPANLSETNLEFLDYEPWHYYRQFKLAIKRYGKEVPIETLGEGVQRLAVIALYRAYLKRHGRNQQAILLIEEPESYLHPQARKTLFKVLNDAIKEDREIEGQIVYTTHSEDFIDCGDFNNIIVFSEKDSEAQARNVSEAALLDHTLALGFVKPPMSNQHIHYRLLETVTHGFKEALFAQKAILVEGATEVELLRFFSNADQQQIAIVSVDGKRNIMGVYSFLTAFGVPTFIMVDRDDKENEQGTNKKIAEALSQSNASVSDSTKIDISEQDIQNVVDGEIFVKERLLVFGKDFETVLRKYIPNYDSLLTELRNAFTLPKNKGPRDIQAFGIALQGNTLGSTALESELAKTTDGNIKLSTTLNSFINQEAPVPSLLKPKPEVSNESVEVDIPF